MRAFWNSCRVIWHNRCLIPRLCAWRHSDDAKRNLCSTLPGSDECPHWLERSFPPGSAQAGAFHCRSELQTLKPTECPSRFGRSFPPGSARARAFLFRPPRLQTHTSPKRERGIQPPARSVSERIVSAAITTSPSFEQRFEAHPSSTRTVSQKDAPQAWVDPPPDLPRPGRPNGGCRMSDAGFREGIGYLFALV
jgi:hypothetical protein